MQDVCKDIHCYVKGNSELNHIFICAGLGKLILTVFIHLSCKLHWNFLDYVLGFSLDPLRASLCEWRYPEDVNDENDESIKKKQREAS